MSLEKEYRVRLRMVEEVYVNVTATSSAGAKRKALEEVAEGADWSPRSQTAVEAKEV